MRILAGGLLVGLLAIRLLAAESPDTDARVEALLSQMTLQKKIGQMTQADMKALRDVSDVQKYCLGSVLSGGSSDPSNNTAIRSDRSPMACDIGMTELYPRSIK